MVDLSLCLCPYLPRALMMSTHLTAPHIMLPSPELAPQKTWPSSWLPGLQSLAHNPNLWSSWTLSLCGADAQVRHWSQKNLYLWRGLIQVRWPHPALQGWVDTTCHGLSQWVLLPDLLILLVMAPFENLMKAHFAFHWGGSLKPPQGSGPLC